MRLILSEKSDDEVVRKISKSSLSSDSVSDLSGEFSANLWRHVDYNCPPEADPPNPELYGTGTERCYAIGLPERSSIQPIKGEPAVFWQMNSRALCYTNKPACLFGHRMDNFLSFEPRGSGSCHVLSVKHNKASDARGTGLNESCAAFRKRYIAQMFGTESFRSFDEWYAEALASVNAKKISRARRAIAWRSDFAIVIPKYPWSYNICHYGRMWNYVMWVIRNLHLFVPDANSITHIHIFFRVGFRYQMLWHQGMHNATIEAVERETGIKLSVAKLRFDHHFNYQCVKQGIWLGREGRVDAFPFFNDSDVWLPVHQINDNHWPTIPHDALWLRQVVSKWSGLPDIGNFSGPHIGIFRSILVPPRRVAVLQRSPRSHRRLTPSGNEWLMSTLRDLCKRYNMELANIRVSGATPFKEQVTIMSRVGISIGLHGANLVNTWFQPAGGALFEIFPWRYVRYYYAAGSNSGLRYSYHEPVGGKDRKCNFTSIYCAYLYRESLIYLTQTDRRIIYKRIENALAYVANLHQQYPNGVIPLRREGNVYYFEKQNR